MKQHYIRISDLQLQVKNMFTHLSIKNNELIFKCTCFCIVCIFFNYLILFSNSAVGQVGEKFPFWKEGYLDIHHINTGRGDATFFIFPDGTTLLMDAGAHSRPPGPREIDVRPDNSRTPGDWISRYIKHMLSDFSLQKLNYLMVNHFHTDHMGDVSNNVNFSISGAYKLSGITEVGEYIIFDNVIDRAWPEYNYPVLLTGENIENYINFLKWHIKHNNVKIEQFKTGRKDQIILVNNPGHYPNFEIRNIAANGHVWTGTDSNAKNYYPPIESLITYFPNENMNSIAFRLSYGRFDYFTGGDLTGIPSPGAPDWHDIETPIARVVGPVEVNVTNHHAHFSSQNEFFIQTLRPRIHIIQSWVVNHPAPSTLSRLLSENLYHGPRDIFATNITNVGRIFIGSAAEKIKGQGHVVIRVYPGGDSYNVFILDDSSESFMINAIYGPYFSD